jgi:hypothetical protein
VRPLVVVLLCVKRSEVDRKSGKTSEK